MLLSSRQRFLSAWLALGILAAAVCSLIWPGAHLDDERLPVANDSFYHARRILDVAQDPGAFYEFDPRIHAPEGSLLTWPWGYDYAMGMFVRAAVHLGIVTEPIAFLIWIPVAAVFLSMGLLVYISRKLGLSVWSTVLAGLCVALSPLTQYLHGVGFIDHHFAEYIFVLATIAAGLRWFMDQQSRAAAAILGLVLGVAPAVHNGLFILQIPVLLMLALHWLQGQQPPRRSTAWFAVSLVSGVITVVIPSKPFQMGLAEYYYLSWFHVYVACSSALFAFIFSRAPRTRGSLTLLTGLGIALLAPLTYQIAMAQSFLVGDLPRLDAIGEMFSLPKLLQFHGPLDISSRYSLFIWLLPLTLVLCAYRLWRERTQARAFFWLSCICGLVLLSLQFRMHNFGSFALYLPWLVAIEEFAAKRGETRKTVMLLASVVCLLMYAPPMRYALLGPLVKANDVYFTNLRPVLGTLQKACAEDPGIVLADNDAGHYIRYYTECSVIANNFLLTKQHGEKVLLLDKLWATPATELPKIAPYVKYVLARPAYITAANETDVRYVSFSPDSSLLVGDLLLKPFAPEPTPPPEQFELLDEERLIASDWKIPYVRLFRIRPESALGDRE